MKNLFVEDRVACYSIFEKKRALAGQRTRLQASHSSIECHGKRNGGQFSTLHPQLGQFQGNKAVIQRFGVMDSFIYLCSIRNAIILDNNR
jgi:hypothetical protein